MTARTPRRGRLVAPALTLCALGVVAAAAANVPGAARHARHTAPTRHGAAAASANADDYASAVSIQRDGKIVAVGRTWLQGGRLHEDDTGDFVLARYTPRGRLDPTFGFRGRVFTHFADSDDASAAVIQDDGKIVVAGSASIDFALARYMPDGRLDPSFGTAGKVLTDFGGSFDHGSAAAIQSDGKIVAAGSSGPSFEAQKDLALARYMPDGRLDPSFGTAGKVLTDFGGTSEFGRAVAVQDDGSILVAGISGPRPSTDAHRDFVLARYTPDGRLDSSFGSGGKVLTDVRSRSSDVAYGTAMAVQGDGKIVLAGGSTDLPFESGDLVLLRYESDGTLDPSFGTGGKVVTDLGSRGADYAEGVAIQEDGKLVAAGTGIARYGPDGRLDQSFGSGGRVVPSFGGGFEVAIQDDGKIVVAGGGENASGWGDFALARYTPDGRLDPSFGSGGKVLTDFASVVTRLASLSAKRTGRAVSVRWQTASEVGTQGFNVYRGAAARRVRVTRKLVRASGGATRGAPYSFLDRRPPRSRSVRYWVEDVRRDGRRLLYGPARVRR